jgi:Fic family protein
MQIVSSRYGDSKVYFEAPPSKIVPKEMNRFLKWFNSSKGSESILVRAALTHLYFENIHPFEDGNGRIGRILVEKAFSQGVGRPILIALSKSFERHRKEYYKELGKCNRTLDANEWVEYFAKMTLEAQSDASSHLFFLMEKSRIMHSFEGEINARQEKVLLRLFEEGPSGFKGGLSAENYIVITKTSRATATRDLADLVERGVLKKTGELRHTRYWLNLKSRGGSINTNPPFVGL